MNKLTIPGLFDFSCPWYCMFSYRCLILKFPIIITNFLEFSYVYVCLRIVFLFLHRITDFQDNHNVLVWDIFYVVLNFFVNRQHHLHFWFCQLCKEKNGQILGVYNIHASPLLGSFCYVTMYLFKFDDQNQKNSNIIFILFSHYNIYSFL